MRSIARYANNWRWTLTKAVTPVVGSFCPCALAVSFPRTGFYHIYAAFWTRDHPDMHPTVLNAYSGRWKRATGQNHPAGWNCRYWALATIGNSLQVLPQSWYRKHRVYRRSPRAGIGNSLQVLPQSWYRKHKSLQVLPHSWYRKHRVSRCSPRAGIGNSLQVLPQSWYRKHRVPRCSPRAGIGNIVSRCSPRAGIGNIVPRCSPRAGIGNIESPGAPPELV